MTRIVHFSDLHGSPLTLPKADIYVGTGDLLANSARLWLWPDKGAEQQWQQEWIKQNQKQWSNMFASKTSPLFLVRGNHDFVNISPLFSSHAGKVHEFTDPEIVIEGSLRIAGLRGVKTINGVWADEMNEFEFKYRLDCLKYKDFDILLTHGPASGILDDSFGSEILREFCELKDFKAHLFGHIHETYGTAKKVNKIYSNAATGYNIIDI